MASFCIHLAVGKRYIDKSKIIKNEKEFYKGIISPDLKKDKFLSHYTGYKDKENLLKYLSQKVQLKCFLKNENIDSDYQKGVFIHLITDYLFFNNFFEYEYLSNVSYQDFFDNLYYSYDITNEYLKDKYNIDYKELSAELKNNIQKKRNEQVSNTLQQNILPFDKLDAFIEYVSSINLENYKNHILTDDNNVLP